MTFILACFVVSFSATVGIVALFVSLYKAATEQRESRRRRLHLERCYKIPAKKK